LAKAGAGPLQLMRWFLLLLLTLGGSHNSFAACAAGEGNNNTLDLWFQKPPGCTYAYFIITITRGLEGTNKVDFAGSPTFSGSPATWHYQLQVNNVGASCTFPRQVVSVYAGTGAGNATNLIPGSDTIFPMGTVGNYTNSCYDGFSPPAPPTNCIVKISVKNNDNVAHDYTIFKNGLVLIASGIPIPAITVAPGGTGVVTLDDPDCSGGYDLRYWELDQYGGGQYTNTTIVSTNTTQTTNTGVPPSNPAPGTNSPPSVNPPSGTNAPQITYNSNSTNLATDGTLKVGLSAIYDALNKGFSGLDHDLRHTESNNWVRSGALSNWLFSNTRSITGALANLSFTNVGGGTNDASAAVRDFHIDNTNLLGTLRDQVTNRVGSPMSVFTGSMTNASDATNAAMTYFGGVASGLDGLVDGIGTPPVVADGGGPAGLRMDFLDTEIDLDPEHFAPGVMQYLKNFITLIALVFFGHYAATLIFKLSQTYATAQTGGVPNIQFSAAGFGGNVLGVTVFAAVVVAFIVVWLVVWYWILGAVTDQLVAMSAIGSIENPAASATYLLTSVFPVPLLLTLAWTRVWLPLGLAKVIGIAATASRFLVGK